MAGSGGSVGVVSHVPVLLRMLAAVVAAAAVLLVLVWALQRRLIYLPAGGPVPSAGGVLPGGEDVTFDTEDGLRLRGWFVPGRPVATGATVLVFDGNAGNRSVGRSRSGWPSSILRPRSCCARRSPAWPMSGACTTPTCRSVRCSRTGTTPPAASGLCIAHYSSWPAARTASSRPRTAAGSTSWRPTRSGTWRSRTPDTTTGA